MKKVIVVLLALMFVSTVAFAMGSTGGCYKTQSCINVWQCYGSSLDACRDEAKKNLLSEKNDPRGYWDAVGACQARLCSK